jgi:hypothetical protein
VNNIDPLLEEWIELKRLEKLYQDSRRSIEDQLIDAIMVPADLDGTVTPTVSQDYKVKITGRMSRKVDSDRVQEIAAEHGIVDQLSVLFRWKPEINMAVWKATNPSVTDLLLDGITTKPGRPSFTIEKE